MKLSDKMIRLALILLIALSVFLSYNIWLSPANTTSSATRNTSVTTETQSNRSADDVFLPLKMMWIQNGGAQGTQSETAISQVQDLLAANLNGEVTQFTGEDGFASEQHITNGVELTYQGSYLLNDYFSTFNVIADNPSEAEGFYFSKIQIDYDGEVVKFINFNKNTYMQMDFSGKEDNFRDILADSTLIWTDLILDDSSTTGQYNSSETILLSSYSYILSTQSSTVFRNAFFQDPDSVTSDDASVFISDQERLEIDSDRQLTEFQGDLPVTEELTDEFNQSFTYIAKLGTSVGNLRYFDREENKLNYRVFVEGYPVFGSSSQGLVSVTVGESTVEDSLPIKIESSTRTIQVPIPSDENVELPSTQTVRSELEAAGADLSLISSIIIGYTWEAIRDVDRVVDLTPEWYIRYDDKWYSERELIAELPEMEVAE